MKLLLLPEMTAAVGDRTSRDGVRIHAVLRAAIAAHLGIEDPPVMMAQNTRSGAGEWWRMGCPSQNGMSSFEPTGGPDGGGSGQP
jgi:hypothetical protein